MIINTKLTVVNRVHHVSVGVELDAQEARYVKAYGEPRVDVAGLFPFDAGNDPIPDQIAFNIEQEIGTPLQPAEAVLNSASDNYEITASGGEFFGFFKGTNEVLGDFRIETQIDHIVDMPVAGIVADYLNGLAILPGSDVSDDTAGVFFGVGEYNGSRVIWAYDRENGLSGMLLGVPVARENPNGVYLRIERTGTDYQLLFSLNNAQTWISYATVNVPAAAPRVGLFTSSGDNNAVVTTLYSNTQFYTQPQAEPDTFEILGSPSMRLIRSQSPLVFQLDGKLDPQAEAKVMGWAAEIRTRLEAAKAALVLNPDPGPNPTVSMSQI